jgi:hypothetical protein
MINEIIKPVKQKPKLKDERINHLEGWKKLFEDISYEIKVILHFEKDFDKVLYELLEDIDFEGGFYTKAKIIVILPKDFRLRYLIGLAYNHMYSEREVIKDGFTVSEYNLPSYQPKTYSWKKFYNEVYKISKEVFNQVPNPISGE